MRSPGGAANGGVNGCSLHFLTKDRSGGTKRTQLPLLLESLEAVRSMEAIQSPLA